MGRYYNGDIEGKFWFGVQSSTDASYFGGEQGEPNFVNYCFEKEDIPSIKEGINSCKKELKGFKSKLDQFFKDKDAYNEEQLAKALKIPVIKVKFLLGWYARLELGEKILKCVQDTDECNFEAEL